MEMSVCFWNKKIWNTVKTKQHRRLLLKYQMKPINIWVCVQEYVFGDIFYVCCIFMNSLSLRTESLFLFATVLFGWFLLKSTKNATSFSTLKQTRHQLNHVANSLTSAFLFSCIFLLMTPSASMIPVRTTAHKVHLL